MNTHDEAEAFRAELRALLDRYRVCIYWRCSEGSDTHGIHDERIVVERVDTPERFLSIDGNYISAYDLRDDDDELEDDDE